MKGYCRRIQAVDPDLLTMSGDGLLQEILLYIESVNVVAGVLVIYGDTV